MGFSRQEYYSRLPFPIAVDLPNPGIKPASFALANKFLTTEPPGKQELFSICKSVNMIHHINKMKDRNHMLTSIDAEKAFNKIKHSLIIKKKKNNLPQSK